ncbi:MAG: VanZ family protein [Crocinitomicaceae bacterium]
MSKTFFYQLSWVVWLGIILVLCLTPGDQLPQIEWEIISIGTVAHFSLYFVLAFLQLAALFSSYRIKSKTFLNLSVIQMYLMVILIGVIIGYGVELIQENFIYRRYYDTEDVLTNGIGTIFGVITYSWIGKK